MLVHEPYPEEVEMYRALEEAYQAGKVRAIGISNVDESRYKHFLSQCTAIPAVNQMETHVFFQRCHLEQTLRSCGTVLQAWAPLAQAMKEIVTHPLLTAIGQRYHKTACQVALTYLIHRGIPVIPKTRRQDRLIENLQILDFKLSTEEMSKIRTLDEGETLFPWTKYA
jgi:diketogulonate reductase-like aldo/keto reductase